jgi:hypothetical protein
VALGNVNNKGREPIRWDLIEGQLPEGSRLTVRLAVRGGRDDVLIGVDALQRRHLLIQIPLLEPTDLCERSTKGISLLTVEMKLDNGNYANFIAVVCLESQGHAALDTILFEIVGALDSGASIDRISLVKNVVGKWRRFWSGVNSGLLSKEQQIGLFGELWFLKNWLGLSIGYPSAVRAWRGPLGSRHDFEASLVGIEIKTCSSLEMVHHIHGIEQLVEPVGGTLFLMSLGVRDEASATDSLPQLIKSIRDLLDNEFDALSHFDSCIYSGGYSDELEAEYSKMKLRVRSEDLYRVAPGFPRVVPSSFCEMLPLSISAVNYELSLAGADPWRVAQNPASASRLLIDFFGGT